MILGGGSARAQYQFASTHSVTQLSQDNEDNPDDQDDDPGRGENADIEHPAQDQLNHTEHIMALLLCIAYLPCPTQALADSQPVSRQRRDLPATASTAC